MSPCICNAMRPCMLYHATYIMNATRTTQTTLFIMCHGQLYQLYIISIQSHIPCQYIYKHIYHTTTTKYVIQNQATTPLILEAKCDIYYAHKTVQKTTTRQAINRLPVTPLPPLGRREGVRHGIGTPLPDFRTLGGPFQ